MILFNLLFKNHTILGVKKESKKYQPSEYTEGFNQCGWKLGITNNLIIKHAVNMKFLVKLELVILNRHIMGNENF